MPNTAARWRGSAPRVRASSSCRSARRRSRVAVRPRHVSVSQFSLTALVVMAVCWLMIRCGLAVPGQRWPRCCSQARSRCGQVVEWAGPAGDGQPLVAEIDVAEVQFADGPVLGLHKPQKLTGTLRLFIRNEPGAIPVPRPGPTQRAIASVAEPFAVLPSKLSRRGSFLARGQVDDGGAGGPGQQFGGVRRR